jgi:DNA-binding ferritin-like protein
MEDWIHKTFIEPKFDLSKALKEEIKVLDLNKYEKPKPLAEEQTKLLKQVEELLDELNQEKEAAIKEYDKEIKVLEERKAELKATLCKDSNDHHQKKQ